MILDLKCISENIITGSSLKFMMVYSGFSSDRMKFMMVCVCLKLCIWLIKALEDIISVGPFIIKSSASIRNMISG